MVELSFDDLAAVIGGGESSTQVGVGPFQYRSTTTDYRTCVDAVTQATAAQYPDTRVLGIFGTDQNAGTRARATTAGIRDTCGPPPTN